MDASSVTLSQNTQPSVKTNIEDTIATLQCAPTMHAVQVMNMLQQVQGEGGTLSLTSLTKALAETQEQLQQGNMAPLETMLYAQAQILQAIFTHCTLRMVQHEHSHGLQIYGQLALKTQNQCRNTLATLAAIKQPKSTTVIHNEAQNQQVNVQLP